jgi:RNA polymerase sigma-70 factor (ECF subfamily)
MAATLAIEATALPVSSTDDDRQLVERAETDPEAFAALYRKYVTDVFRYCYRKLQDRENAEDATSQIFLNAYRALPTLRGKPFRPWLFSIAHNVVIDAYRRNNPMGASLDGMEDWADPAESPEGIAIEHERRDVVRALLDQLPRRDRDVMELRLAGLNGLEIAQTLHCSAGAVRTAHYRALERLRQLMTFGEGISQ